MRHPHYQGISGRRFRGHLAMSIIVVQRYVAILKFATFQRKKLLNLAIFYKPLVFNIANHMPIAQALVSSAVNVSKSMVTKFCPKLNPKHPQKTPHHQHGREPYRELNLYSFLNTDAQLSVLSFLLQNSVELKKYQVFFVPSSLKR